MGGAGTALFTVLFIISQLASVHCIAGNGNGVLRRPTPGTGTVVDKLVDFCARNPESCYRRRELASMRPILRELIQRRQSKKRDAVSIENRHSALDNLKSDDSDVTSPTRRIASAKLGLTAIANNIANDVHASVHKNRLKDTALNQAYERASLDFANNKISNQERELFETFSRSYDSMQSKLENIIDYYLALHPDDEVQRV